MPTSITFKSKFLNPCNKLLQLLRFRPKRPIFKSPFRFKKIRGRRRRCLQRKKRGISGLFNSLSSFPWPSMIMESNSKESVDDVAGEQLSMGNDPARGCLLFPSPVTPAYKRLRRSIQRIREDERDVDAINEEGEDACRSFESYLSEMIIEEGKVGDLVDVEELLYCWKNLKCPVFHGLVCRFYGELCRDLFSGEE
ncbi:hypothetical protein ACLOJK_031427 [Asimina triloba]